MQCKSFQVPLKLVNILKNQSEEKKMAVVGKECTVVIVIIVLQQLMIAAGSNNRDDISVKAHCKNEELQVSISLVTAVPGSNLILKAGYDYRISVTSC
jgi:hypothetical protein